jgi:hypothetical protein
VGCLCFCCAADVAVTVTRDQEIWALALWVERTHGEGGAAFIAERIAHFEAEGTMQAVELWKQVARRFEELGPT